VDFVSPRVDPANQLLVVKAPAPNIDRRFRNDQTVYARVIWKQLDAPLIPVTAVQRLAGQFFAFIAESDGKQTVAKQRALKVGEIVGNDYVVLEGIKPGEQVIVGGTQLLADGAPVTPQKAGEAPAQAKPDEGKR
jgi:hypothetical protein